VTILTAPRNHDNPSARAEELFRGNAFPVARRAARAAQYGRRGNIFPEPNTRLIRSNTQDDTLTVA
jgi:hypothetical protein